MMNGMIDWSGLPIIVELLGVEDVEVLIEELLTIKEFNRRG